MEFGEWGVRDYVYSPPFSVTSEQRWPTASVKQNGPNTALAGELEMQSFGPGLSKPLSLWLRFCGLLGGR